MLRDPSQPCDGRGDVGVRQVGAGRLPRAGRSLQVGVGDLSSGARIIQLLLADQPLAHQRLQTLQVRFRLLQRRAGGPHVPVRLPRRGGGQGRVDGEQQLALPDKATFPVRLRGDHPRHARADLGIEGAIDGAHRLGVDRHVFQVRRLNQHLRSDGGRTHLSSGPPATPAPRHQQQHPSIEETIHAVSVA